ncbi:MAG: WYL domain-containing protein [Sporomusaceae bacterium]|nr:WYL domain-containing protein [Sporomusaceae bacterium]
MSYSELIKNYSRIRDYMREFFVYGFKSRSEYEQKSSRSYDNERRRIESYLSDYMSFRQDATGKNVFISVDSRRVPRNPLYKAWKAAGFTKNDISLHFLLLDILSPLQAKSISELLTAIDTEYLNIFSEPNPIDESTLRKKLKEYVQLGLVASEKQGKQVLYRLPQAKVNLEVWQDAVSFFAEENPLGIVGSFLLDKYQSCPDFFAFKHHYLLFTLDSGIMLDLLTAINTRQKVALELFGREKNRLRRVITLPVKIFISTHGGRQYLASFNTRSQKLQFHRLDSIQKVQALDVQPDFNIYLEYFQTEITRIWGVATGKERLEHLEMRLRIMPDELHIVRRLEREKRCGAVRQLGETVWLFTADVYNAQELMPWLRTFIGRIESLTCSDKIVEERFWSDYALLLKLYGGDGSAV